MTRYERDGDMELIISDGHLIKRDGQKLSMEFFKSAEGEKMKKIWELLNAPAFPKKTRSKKKMTKIEWYVIEYKNDAGNDVTEHYPTALARTLAGIKLKRRGIAFTKSHRVANVE